VREIIVPVLHERIHVATLYAGAWRGQPSRRELNDAPRQPALCTAHRKLPDLDPARAESIAGQLQVWAEGLTSLISALRFAEASDDRAGQIRRCVARGAHRKFGLTDLAAELHLSPSRASHVVRECCGMSFQELLLRERIGRARVLLQASPHRLSAIAERCGFSDAAQFSRLFKREVGMSPGAWRRRHATRAAMV
jgi:AraC-like DNA-binding protein